MEYHPGGEDELMRAAGSDGTDLFDQVRCWKWSFYPSWDHTLRFSSVAVVERKKIVA